MHSNMPQFMVENGATTVNSSKLQKVIHKMDYLENHQTRELLKKISSSIRNIKRVISSSNSSSNRKTQLRCNTRRTGLKVGNWKMILSYKEAAT